MPAAFPAAKNQNITVIINEAKKYEFASIQKKIQNNIIIVNQHYTPNYHMFIYKTKILYRENVIFRRHKKEICSFISKLFIALMVKLRIHTFMYIKS